MMIDNRIRTFKGWSDNEFAQKVDLSDLDQSRKDGVDQAFKYLEMKYDGSSGAVGPAMVVTAFAVGSGLIGTLWYISNNLNILPF